MDSQSDTPNTQHPIPNTQHPITSYLFLLGVGASATYAAALLRFPLLQIYAQPLQNLDKLTASDWRAGLTLAACVVLLFSGYALGARLIQTATHPPRAALIALFPLIFAALLLFVYPATSIDLYDYLFRGRMLARYQVNTFVSVPQDFDKDALFQYVAWRRSVTAYGPVWERMSWLTARLVGESPASTLPTEAVLLRLLLGYKLLGALGFALCGAAIWLALRHNTPQQRVLGLYLWLWNPLALWESVAAGHNDAWMALLIVVAVALLASRQGEGGMRRGGEGGTWGRANKRMHSVPPHPFTPSPLHPLAAFVALTLGGLIKYMALIFGPLLLVAALRQLPDGRSRVRLLLIGAAVCVLLVIVAYAQFWIGPATLRQFSDRGTLFTASWLAALQALIVQWGWAAKETVQPLVASSGLALLAGGVLWSAWRAWRWPDAVAEHALWLLLWFLFVCNPWFQPWYLLWALALVALQPWHVRAMWMITVFCATALLSYLPGPFLLPLLADPQAGWNDSAAWNALLTLLIYVPPLLALNWRRWPRWPQRRSARVIAGAGTQAGEVAQS